MQYFISRAGAGQEQGRSRARAGQEQGESRAGVFYLYFLPIFAPMQYFMSRVGAGQEQGRSRAGPGQEEGRSRVRAGQEQEQEPNHSPNTKFHPNWA